ncbi:sulfurtransferase [Methylophaga lonarensis MPL]|uniref:Sulfurtransferase n=1 Tax=Methylophaga lonarensis MPL TaxID=1286106 RepID=M7PRE2_9GAMM|nr:rhodanese-like domain-containing protein [Methylophaga lonarensis]EMR13009.1 sulfurtransferase [Methylophaga lonarensis MPL]
MSVEKISAEQFLQLQPAEDLCLLDVRTAAEVRNDALPGIIEVPVDQLDAEKFKTILQQRDHSGPVYLICQSGRRAEIAASKLAKAIENPLLIVEGGMAAIRQKKKPTTTTTGTMISLERQVRIAVGILIILTVLAGFIFSPVWFGVTGLMGLGLLYAGITDNCMLGMIMAKAPWNR